MKIYNALLDLDYLTGDFINLLKNLSLAACAGLIVLAIIGLIYVSMKENNMLHSISTIIIILAIIAYSILIAILIIFLISYPAAFMSALIKNFIITKYLLLLSGFQEIILNLIITSISCIVWFGFLIAIISNLNDTPTTDE